MKIDDTTMLCAAALQFGFDTVLIANRVITIELTGSSGVAFARGVAPSTHQATSAILEEQDVVRSLLASMGIPVPRSQTRTFRALDSSAERTLSKFGGKALLRPAWQANRVLTATGPDDLRGRIKTLRSVAGRHASRTSRPQSRLMVEEISQPISGGVLVSHGKVLAAPAGLATAAKDVAVRAVAVFPGLDVALVRLATRPEDGSTLVVSLGAWPRFGAFGEDAPRLARSVVSSEVQQAGGQMPERFLDEIAVQLVIGGVPNPERLTDALRSRRVPENLTLHEITAVDANLVHATAEGGYTEIAALVDDIMAGTVGGVLPLRVETTQFTG